jgi:hypothetical protein
VEATFVTEFNIAVRTDLNGAVLEAGAHHVDGLRLQRVLITTNEGHTISHDKTASRTFWPKRECASIQRQM